MAARLALAWACRLNFSCTRIDFYCCFKPGCLCESGLPGPKNWRLMPCADVASRLFFTVDSACCTYHYPMKFIIALKDQEVKRYVIILKYLCVNC